MTKTDALTIRKVTADDAECVHRLICGLAHFEKLDEANLSTVEALRAELASDDSELEALLAEVDGKSVGLATFFRTYSTFAAKRGIYLEDLFIAPEYRQQGIASRLMRALGALAVERGYGRIEWTTLLWNSKATEFFESLGASPSDAWTTFRLDGEWLERLAQDDS